jgi:CHAT domain-containing protein
VLCLNGAATEDGFLQAREVYHLKLDADLVVLSACQTGRGPFIAGDGVQGLPRAFFAAGARAVLMSLWDVNDQWTAELMKAFYRHLGAGLTQAAALRQAKLDLLSSEPSRDPRLWAALVLTGEADQPIKISGPSWFHRYRTPVMILALVLMLAVVGGYSLRRRTPRVHPH